MAVIMRPKLQLCLRKATSLKEIILNLCSFDESFKQSLGNF